MIFFHKSFHLMHFPAESFFFNKFELLATKKLSNHCSKFSESFQSSKFSRIQNFSPAKTHFSARWRYLHLEDLFFQRHIFPTTTTAINVENRKHKKKRNQIGSKTLNFPTRPHNQFHTMSQHFPIKFPKNCH